MSDDAGENLPIESRCPRCGHPLASAGPEEPLTCAHCASGTAPAPDAFEVVDDEEPPPQESSDLPEDELSAIRIRQIAAGRRATYRARSYCIIAAGVCLVATAQLGWMIVQQFHAAGWGMQCTGYALFAFLGIWGVTYFAARAAQLHREANQSSLTQLTYDPDFSTLDNGSKRVQNLEDVR